MYSVQPEPPSATSSFAALTVPLTARLLRAGGTFIYPTTSLTGLRVIAGTAVLLAVAAVSPSPSARSCDAAPGRWPPSSR